MQTNMYFYIQTAERCLGEIFASDVNVKIIGNAPLAAWRYKYPKKVAERLEKAGNNVGFWKVV